MLLRLLFFSILFLLILVKAYSFSLKPKFLSKLYSNFSWNCAWRSAMTKYLNEGRVSYQLRQVFLGIWINIIRENPLHYLLGYFKVCSAQNVRGSVNAPRQLYSHFFDMRAICTVKWTSQNDLPTAGFLRCFRDPIQVPRIENRVPSISENYHRVPRIREIGSLQDHTGYLTFSSKKTDPQYYKNAKHIFINKHTESVCWCTLHTHMSPYCATQWTMYNHFSQLTMHTGRTCSFTGAKGANVMRSTHILLGSTGGSWSTYWASLR